MTECNFCSDNVSMPFTCSLCNQKHCSKHRLPETHSCTNIAHFDTDTYRKQKLAKARLPENTITASSIGYASVDRFGSRGDLWSSGNPNKDVLYAGLLVALLSVFSTLGSGFSNFIVAMPISSLYAIFGMFMIYFVRQRVCQMYGLSTRFYFWPIGIAITVVLSIIGSIWLLIGYFFIEGEATGRAFGRVGIFSTLTAISIFFLSLIIGAFSSNFAGDVILETGGTFLLMAVLNLLPLWGLDGQRLYEWESKYYWLMLIGTILLIVAYWEVVFKSGILF